MPPGFETTHAHPEPAKIQDPIPTPAATQKTNVLPVLPAVPTLPAVPRTSTPKPKEATKPSKVSDPATVDIAAGSKKEALEISLGSPKPKVTRTTSQQVKNESASPHQERLKEQAASTVPSPSKVSETKPAQKPQKIDIPSRVSATTESSSLPDKPVTPGTSSIVATPPMMSPRPSTPATVTSEVSRSSVPRPRTLRVTTGAQKSVTDPTLTSATTEQSNSTFPPPANSHSHPRVASRHQSISSTAKFDSPSQGYSRPSTPAMSERLASEAVSRASSPPPSIVGSAPERTKTKNQLKKERREKARTQNKSLDSTNDVPTPAATAAVTEAVGPIVARQKKQKKSKPQPAEKTSGKAKATEKKPVEEDAANEDTRSVADDESKPDTPIQEETPVEEDPIPDQPPFTLRDMYNGAQDIRAGELSKEQRIRMILNHKIPQSSMPKMFSSMIESGDLSKDHPWLNPAGFSFNSPSYKLPTDGRKGQDYLDAHGYVGGSYAFGHVYLPVKEKKALERGSAVGIANTPSPTDNQPGNGRASKRHQSQNEQEDLLKRCLITPSGTVYRHLTAQEADKVLELEQRRQWYVEEFGEDVGGMHALSKPLEQDDYINLAGGMEELGRYGERHGVVWVNGGDADDAEDSENDDDDYDNDRDLEDLHDDGAESDETEDLGIDQLDPTAAATMGLGGAWNNHQETLPSFSTASYSSTSAVAAGTTLAPMRNQPAVTASQNNVNLRALDIETLQKRVQETKKEAEESRRGVEAVEKSLGKWSKEMRKWREGVLRA